MSTLQKNQQITVRNAEEKDAGAIRSLLNVLNESENNPVRHALMDAQQLIQQSKNASVGRVPLLLLLAESEGEIVGFLVAYEGFDVASMTYGMHVADMVVQPTKRRRGIGRLLLKHLAKICATQNGAWMSLTCLQSNIVGHNFYTALGFSEVSVQFFAMGKTAMQAL